MKYKVKLTVIDKKLYPELQQEHCFNPQSGTCPCYNIGDEFIFYRDEKRDDFWHCGLNTLTKTMVILIWWLVDLKCRFVQNYGMLFQDTYILDCKVVRL